MGQPSPDFSTVIDAIMRGGANIAAVLLGLFAEDAGCPDSTLVTLPGGTTKVTIGDAKTKYANLLLNWLKQWAPQEVVRAAMADYTGDVYMAWFAQWSALNTRPISSWPATPTSRSAVWSRPRPRA